MKCLVLGSGRFKNMNTKVVALSGPKKMIGAGNPGRGAYVKKDFDIPVGQGLPLGKKKLQPLKFKM